MKKILFFLIFIILISSCRFFDPPAPEFNNSADNFGFSDYYEIKDLINSEPEML